MRTPIVFVAAAIVVIAAFLFLRDDGRAPPGPAENTWQALDQCRFGFFTDCTEIAIDPCSQSARQPGFFKNRTMTVSMAPSIKTEYWEARITPDPLPEDFARHRVTFFSIPPSGKCDGFIPVALPPPAQFFHFENGLDGVGISTGCRIAFIVGGVKGNPTVHSVQFIDPTLAFVISSTGSLVNPLGDTSPCNDFPGVARGVFFSPDMSVGAVIGGTSASGPQMWRQFHDIDRCPNADPHQVNGKICSAFCLMPRGASVSLEMSDPGPMFKNANIVILRVPGQPNATFDTGCP